MFCCLVYNVCSLFLQSLNEILLLDVLHCTPKCLMLWPQIIVKIYQAKLCITVNGRGVKIVRLKLFVALHFTLTSR